MNTAQNAPITLVAGEALAANRRVKLSSGQAIYSDAGEDFIGVTEQAAASGSPVSVRLIGSGTLAIECAGSVTAYAAVYGAADGKIDDTASGKCIGFIQETGASGKVCEVVPTFNGPAAALTATAVTNSTGQTAVASVAAISAFSTAFISVTNKNFATLVDAITKLRADIIGA